MDDRSGFSDDDGTGKKRTGKERVEFSLFGGGSCTRIDSVVLVWLKEKVVNPPFVFL
jgi:hypothetical protein